MNDDRLPLLLYLAPLCLAFEVWQLVIAERHLGLKQITLGRDPREKGPRESVAFFWSAAIISYWIWMILMLLPKFGRPQVVCMLVITLLGYSLRRNSRLKWVLVFLTLEGALRIGMLLSLLGAAWRRL